VFARLEDWHQTLSWKLGYGRGKAGRPYSCPWWVHKFMYDLAYAQGKGERQKASWARSSWWGAPLSG